MNSPTALRSFAFRRQDRLVTTWKLRALLMTLSALIIWISRGVWIQATARSLICHENREPSDLILIDNSDPDYLSFEAAATLRKANVSSHVAAPVEADGANPSAPNMVSAGIAEVMSRIAWLGDYDLIPVLQQEPITLNVAYQVREYATRRRMRSIVIAVPAFRSKRTMLIYDAVMREAGIKVGCAPVFGRTTAKNSASSWHGIEGVAEQFMKLQYYRFAVLPFMHHFPPPRPLGPAH